MRRDDWTKVLGWTGYTVYRHEIDEKAKTLRLWVRRKRGNRRLICSGCGRRITDPADITEREVRDLPCFHYRTTVVIELYRVRCPECGLKIEKVDQLPSKRGSPNASKRRWERPARVLRHDGWPSSLGCPRALSEPSICDIWSAGMRGAASQPCDSWGWMRSFWERRRNSSQW